MKIQPKTQSVSSKQNTHKSKSADFKSVYLQSSSMEVDQPIFDEEAAHQPLQQQEQPLKKVLVDLEDIIQHLDQGTSDHRRAQRAIDSLKDAIHDIPDTFALSAQDREEAEALLIVESKRLDFLKKYEG